MSLKIPAPIFSASGAWMAVLGAVLDLRPFPDILIAAREGLKITTVRWRLQNIFDRTGARCQTDLVSMLVSLFGWERFLIFRKLS
jgi:membrane associated rhomboid family serine protease